MDNKEIKIDVPEGYEIDEENSTFKCIKFKKKKTLPSTWKEFCNDYPRRKGETWISPNSNLEELVDCSPKRDFLNDQNILPSRELAAAMLALCQLIQLRDCYNEGWKPDWENEQYDKFTIRFYKNIPDCDVSNRISGVMVFKSKELMDLFLENFRDLIEIAKPLL